MNTQALKEEEEMQVAWFIVYFSIDLGVRRILLFWSRKSQRKGKCRWRSLYSGVVLPFSYDSFFQ